MTIVSYVQCDTCKRRFFEDAPPVHATGDGGRHECERCMINKATGTARGVELHMWEGPGWDEVRRQSKLAER